MADDRERGLDAILNKLPLEDAKEIVKGLVFDSIREGRLGQSDAVRAMVEGLTSETGDTREDRLLKALILYEAAVEAVRKGQRLCWSSRTTGSSGRSSGSVATVEPTRRPRRSRGSPECSR